MLRIGELTVCSDVDPVACRVVEVSTMRSITPDPRAVIDFSCPSYTRPTYVPN
jgi:hypothetical protein